MPRSNNLKKFVAKSKESRCKYHLPEQTSEAEYSCIFEMEEGLKEPYCIFHFSKSDYQDNKEAYQLQIEARFQSGINQIVEDSKFSKRNFIDFRGFEFPNIVFNTRFPKKADFSHSTFYDDVDFAALVENPKPEFEGDLQGSLLILNGCNFYNSTFKGNVNFNSIVVNNSAHFSNVKFEKDVDFSFAKFEHDANFYEVEFLGTAKFDYLTARQANFEDAKFLQKASFFQFTVDSSSSFMGVIFTGEADFRRSKFGLESYLNFQNENELKEEDINDNSFPERVSFYNVSFAEKADFSGAVFYMPIEFNNAVFRKQILFISEDDERFDAERIGMFQNSLDFLGVTLPKDEECIFYRTDLSKARFHDTNLEKIIFRDVKWATAKTKFEKLLRGKGYLLWDEIRPLDHYRDYLDDMKTAENYRQLVLNYESKRDYETAEFFHIGEMEIRRKKIEVEFSGLLEIFGVEYDSKFYRIWNKYKLYILNRPYYCIHYLWKKFNGYNFYLISSRYGTSYAQAFLVLILLILSFSFFTLFTGVKTSKDVNNDYPKTIEYNLIPSSKNVVASPRKILSDYIETVSYSLSVITFQKDRFYEPLDWKGRYLLFLMVFVLTAQAALVLLAVRRQFKR